MGNWGLWHITAFTALWITVALSAIDQAFKALPELARRIEPGSPRAKLGFRTFLAFAPLVLLITATLIFVGRAYGIIGNQESRPPAATGFTQQQVDDRVKANLAPLQSDLASKVAELNNTRQKLADTQRVLNELRQQKQLRIGPNVAINFASGLGLSGNDLNSLPKTYVIVTSAPENEQLRSNLEDIFNQAWGLSHSKSPLLLTGLPNYEKDIELRD